MGFVVEIVPTIIDLISFFSERLDGFLGSSMISRARKQQFLNYRAHNLRQWCEDEHSRVDDRPFGGGVGMVLRPGPIVRAISDLRKEQSYVIYRVSGNLLASRDLIGLSKKK
jgi:tRNA (guanine37-N1)-methyltransferase